MRKRDRRDPSRERIIEYPIDEDVRREFDAHLEMRVAELVAEGWTRDAAEAEARRLFGDIEAVRRECTEISGRHRATRERALRIETFWQDVKFGARSLRRSPGFAVTAILTLALAIGANTAIFTVVNRVFLRPLPYPDSDRIVQVHERTERGTDNAVAWANFRDWEDRSRSFAAMAAWGGGTATVLGGDEAVRTRYSIISRDFLEVLGVRPSVGRGFTPEETGLGGDPAALVSHAYWTTWMGSDPDLSSRTLEIAGNVARIVGVLPPGFDFPEGTDLWVPLEREEQTESRTAHNYRVVARLADGIDPATADQELDRITAQLVQEHAEIDAASAHVVGLQEQLAGPIRRPLLLLFGSAGLLLLVACTNLASALLARASGRAQEVAVRTALGAGRRRLVRQMVTESLLLTAIGALVGFALVPPLLRGISALAPAGLFDAWDVGPDVGVVLFTVGLALVTAIAFGLFPALRATEGGLGTALREGGRGSAGRKAGGWAALVTMEVALAMMLLVGSGLLLRSFWGLVRVDPGFSPDPVLTVDLALPASRYVLTYPDNPRENPEDHDHSAPVQYHDELLRRVRAIPGVRAAGIANHVPLSGTGLNGAFEIEGRSEDDGGYANYRIVSAGYFDALAIPLLRGRAIEEADREETRDVVVVNQALVDAFFPDADPIGRRIRTGGMDIHFSEWTTIVGVVGNVRNNGLDRDARPEYYLAHRQRGDRILSATLALRVEGAVTAVIPPVRTLLRALDPDVPVVFRSMSGRLGDSLADRRFTVAVLGGFAAVGLLLALVGIHGVVAYWVARRTRELGIRLAMGASPQSVLGSVLFRTLRPVLAGIVLGVVGSLALTRVVRFALHDVSPTDPAVFAAVAALLVGAGLVAGYLPARRVTRIDPTVSLRSE